MSDDLTRGLELAVAQVERQFGKGSIIRMGNDKVEPWPAISTGAMTLDRILGIGGLPKGRIVEIYGPEAAGKTTLAMSTVVEAQKQGATAAYIDVEHALDPVYMKALGVNLDNLLLSQPSSGEAALEIVHTLVKSGDIGIVVLDSVAALLPLAEIDEDIGKPLMAVQARLMSQALRKLPEAAHKTGTLIVFINQLRSTMSMYSPDVTPGGKALDYAASVRIDIRKTARVGQRSANILDANGNIVGISTRVKTVKNRMAAPFKEAFFDIIFGQGIDQFRCLVEVAVELGIINKNGAWYAYKDEKIQGMDGVMSYLASDLDVKDEIQRKTYDAISR